MAKTAAIEYINHFNAVRLRVVGSGNLRMTLQSYDEVFETELTPIPMEQTTNKTPTQLTNFTQQTAKLRIETTEKDEIFNIGWILVYVKSVGTEFPR